ncbi:peptide/nickel transport system ATP-binding protein [Ottowia thiooxydans]|uniref:Peptide/nickel transport system ATP-binding protein n=2 Tax=Ottowia thiooxydans TaxID=219182 RepID=A0ABV2QAY3_9BURK
MACATSSIRGGAAKVVDCMSEDRDRIDKSVLDIQKLSLSFITRAGRVHALDKVSLQVKRGECVALIGESGSGKSITGMAVMRLLGTNAEISAEHMSLAGQDILGMPPSVLRHYRGRRVAMIFQNAKAALNPIRRVGDTLVDILVTHAPHRTTRAQARKKVLEVMVQLGIAHAEERMAAYPAELSGGMCQRIMIVAALVCEPELIIADEPTSALDVTTQVKVMNLLIEACRQRHLACLFITHDLALAAEHCDRAVVMHAGQVLEVGSSEEVLSNPAHPYTRMLVAAMPSGKSSHHELQPMRGGLPDLRRNDLPACRFAERCSRAEDICLRVDAPRQTVAPFHHVSCHHPHVS